ncbi:MULTISPECIES: HEAT repeat domain-containing protein [unclassified Streptomyces]|uniref:HEAT repeat domain-containing protein n=1 Tax=unclassified Streptomyces TaxID=2593676 RepID=UPI003663670E
MTKGWEPNRWAITTSTRCCAPGKAGCRPIAEAGWGPPEETVLGHNWWTELPWPSSSVAWSEPGGMMVTGLRDLLEGLWSASRVTAARTCANLHYADNGDGSSVRVAAAEMLPFLIEAARDPDPTVRFEILQTIAHVAGTGNTAPTAKAAPVLAGTWRPTVDPAWPGAWERAADALLPLLDDEDYIIRAGAVGAVGALAQSAAHADTLITRSRTCFDSERNPWVAEASCWPSGSSRATPTKHGKRLSGGCGCGCA